MEEVSLQEMLDEREARFIMQKQLIDTYQKTLICFTMNIAGPVKNSPLISKGFFLGKRALDEALGAEGIVPVYFEEYNKKTGPTAFYVVDADPLFIKKITTKVEDSGRLGRLLDIDVIGNDGLKADRLGLDLPPRTCLLCQNNAKDCGRSRRHTVDELWRETVNILEEASINPKISG